MLSVNSASERFRPTNPRACLASSLKSVAAWDSAVTAVNQPPRDGDISTTATKGTPRQRQKSYARSRVERLGGAHARSSWIGLFDQQNVFDSLVQSTDGEDHDDSDDGDDDTEPLDHDFFEEIDRLDLDLDPYSAAQEQRPNTFSYDAESDSQNFDKASCFVNQDGYAYGAIAATWPLQWSDGYFSGQQYSAIDTTCSYNYFAETGRIWNQDDFADSAAAPGWNLSWLDVLSSDQ
ncbi:MAG: hypothetical protein FRX48_07414 [Lasallia pustulata]|uniref:Uncharacterized protein n=1 Tax=Lasallia pustulata TaxID=136370 RepID=A0A5M8PJI4_9LECA|nr:MAG: hypothetical protein FRX48_07414 [Lasallia pustulata]